jgi:hypothetical protein
VTEPDGHVRPEEALREVGVRAADRGVRDAHAHVFGTERLIGEIDHADAAACVLIGIAEAADLGDGDGSHV